MRAHLLGGVPKVEIAAKAALFAAQGLDAMALFVARDARYVDFHHELDSRRALKPAVESHPGVLAREQALRQAFEAWWPSMAPSPRWRARQAPGPGLRNDLLHSLWSGAGARGLTWAV